MPKNQIPMTAEDKAIIFSYHPVTLTPIRPANPTMLLMVGYDRAAQDHMTVLSVATVAIKAISAVFDEVAAYRIRIAGRLN